MKAPDPISSAHHFTHDAMNTTFSMRIHGVEHEAARGMAGECRDQLDYLEARLSRFIEGSDVSRINRLRAGETLYLSEPCHQCLLLALQGHASTGGLFDITLGTQIAHLKSGESAAAPPITGRLTLHPDIAAITCDEPGREIDLGGIAKGFALDQLKQLLTEWDAPGALLAAGASSLLAFGPHAWPIDLTGEREVAHILLTNQSLSASGTSTQGNHILHPGGSDSMPVRPSTRVWVLAETAALAEIWSTALMLVSPEKIAETIMERDDIVAVYAERDEGVVTLIR